MTIQSIKAKLSILTVLSHYNLSANKNGMLCCPFHSDQKASMKVYNKTNTVYCFAGSCEVGSLDVIDFILKMEKCTKHEAIVKAKTLCNSPLSNNLITKPTMQKTNKTSSFNQYVKSLELHQQAKNYLQKRGLESKQIEVGYKSRRTKTTWARNLEPR